MLVPEAFLFLLPFLQMGMAKMKWEIPYLDPSFEAEVSLYNRYGQLVLSCKRYRGAPGMEQLKGVAQGSGVYVYVIKSKLFPIDMHGTFVLIR